MSLDSWIALAVFFGFFVWLLLSGAREIRKLTNIDWRAVSAEISRDLHEKRELRRATLAQKLRAVDLASMDPIAFEHHCATILETQGWLCEVTQASGDFGVDVIAKRPGAKVAIQVKKWAAAVNLSAVQEVVAGCAHCGAHHAAVVSVSGYLPSARELARANDVLLLSYDDLFDFNRRVHAWLR